MQFLKDILGDVRKSVVQLIIGGLAASGVVASATATLWGSLLAIPDSQLSPIRYWLLFAGSIALIAVAFGFYIRTFRKLQAVQVSLATPHKISDDYEHLPDRGFWVHKQQPSKRVCGNCLLPPIEIVSPLSKFTVSWPNPLDNYRILSAPVWKCERKDCGKTYARKDDDI